MKRTSKLFSVVVTIKFLIAGDIESMPFIEALGQFSYRVGRNFSFPLM